VRGSVNLGSRRAIILRTVAVAGRIERRKKIGPCMSTKVTGADHKNSLDCWSLPKALARSLAGAVAVY
jgi:hypothetical protein